jgi:hypothetical protein
MWTVVAVKTDDREHIRDPCVMVLGHYATAEQANAKRESYYSTLVDRYGFSYQQFSGGVSDGHFRYDCYVEEIQADPFYAEEERLDDGESKAE